jgi:hypothetical protein
MNAITIAIVAIILTAALAVIAPITHDIQQAIAASNRHDTSVTARAATRI